MLDANAAKFEELRELGLSVSQSARVIAYRDTTGGFHSRADLGKVPGLQQEVHRVLGEALSVEGG